MATRKLVEKIRERKTLGEQAVLFAIDVSSNMILTSQERASLLEKLGVDVLVECQLNDRIRHMKAENFIKEILMGGSWGILRSSGRRQPVWLRAERYAPASYGIWRKVWL